MTSPYKIEDLDILHNYVNELSKRTTSSKRQQIPVAQERKAIYIKPLGELGDLPKASQKSFKQSIVVQNGHQIDPSTLYSTTYDNVGTQEPWIPTIRRHYNDSGVRGNDVDKPSTGSFVSEHKTRLENLTPEPFGDTVIHARVRVSGNNAQVTQKAKNTKNRIVETSTESITELSTSSNQKYYYYPTSFPTNHGPFSAKNTYPKQLHKRPRVATNSIKPPKYKQTIPPDSTASERKDSILTTHVAASPNVKVKTVSYHNAEPPQALIRPERDCKFDCFS